MEQEQAREQKNAVFGTNDSIKRQVEAMRVQMGSALPVNRIPLPSRGKVYPQTSSLHDLEAVELRAMTTQEENILSTPALIKNGTVISALIQACLVDKAINVGELLSGDRNVLMVAIRSEGYGNEYDAKIKCPECSETFEHTFNLNEFPLKFLELEPVEPGKNEFPFTLPKSGTKVTFKFLTGTDEEDIVATQASRKKLKTGGAGVDDTKTLTLQYSLLSVDGNRDKMNVSNFIRNMRAADSLALRKYMSDNQPGIEMSESIKCPHCNAVDQEVTMPIGASFFWPDS
jgi:hypothetical protein